MNALKYALSTLFSFNNTETNQYLIDSKMTLAFAIPKKMSSDINCDKICYTLAGWPV